MKERIPQKTYRISLIDEPERIRRQIEFNATDAGAALCMTHQVCGSRPVELSEDGKRIAHLQHTKRGFWLVS